MPKHVSDDIDHVPIEPATKKHKNPPQHSGSYLISNLQLVLNLPLMAIAPYQITRRWKDHLDAVG